ncbi:hypothetical protein GCM10010326_60950 [Streptomyces xanthochromogenes]|uniref:Secreted protein n=1 Tax=Streptomyces xanthochromogenes TaxID=67384 RepID=A0ABQ3AIX4_9ACTN|nr:hypothetical protein GCM10010326_60950 [Streptomyces xanthochromogenes]
MPAEFIRRCRTLHLLSVCLPSGVTESVPGGSGPDDGRAPEGGCAHQDADLGRMATGSAPVESCRVPPITVCGMWAAVRMPGKRGVIHSTAKSRLPGPGTSRSAKVPRRHGS